MTGQKQRFNEISSHILVSILVLSHAYGTFTNIKNLHHASYGSLRVLITDQCSSRLFYRDIAMSKIFKYRPVKNRTTRYATTCVLSGNVAFGQNFIPHVDTCQSAMKSLFTIKSSANGVLILSKHQTAASRNFKVLSGIIRILSCKLAIFIEFRYSFCVFPGETHVLPGIIVEICWAVWVKPEKTKKIIKQNETKDKQYWICSIIQDPPLKSVSRVIQSVSQSVIVMRK